VRRWWCWPHASTEKRSTGKSTRVKSTNLNVCTISMLDAKEQKVACFAQVFWLPLVVLFSAASRKHAGSSKKSRRYHKMKTLATNSVEGRGL
jgi:hypothetical protein